MYTPNEHFSRILAWILSGSILTSSCTNTVVEEVGGPLEINKKRPYSNCAIRVSLSNADAEYIEKMARLADDLVKDPKIAQCLLSDKQTLLKARAMDQSNLQIDQELERVTLAFADEDVSHAIKERDIKKYLLLMNDRGFLKKTNSEHYDVLTVEQRKEILLDLGVPEEEVDNFPFLVGAVISIFYFAVAVISYGAVAYTAIASVNMAALATVAYKVAAVTSTKVSGYTNLDISKDTNFDIWILKCDDETISMPIKEYEGAIQEVIDAYRQIGGEKMKALSDNQLKLIMIKNILENLKK